MNGAALVRACRAAAAIFLLGALAWSGTAGRATAAAEPRPSAAAAADVSCLGARPRADAQVILLSAGLAEGVSTASLSTDGRFTRHAFADIEAGERPIHLLLDAAGPVVWTFRGAVERIDRVVLLGGPAGVAGLPLGRVIPASAQPDCVPRYAAPDSAEAMDARRAVNRAYGRSPDSVLRADWVTAIALPSGRVTRTLLSPGPPPLPGFDPAVWKEALISEPAGVQPIDLTAVQGASARPQDILPGMFGLAQLTHRGVLQHLGRRDFRLLRPLARWPGDLVGFHGPRVLVPRGFQLPAGDIGHGCLIWEETGESAPGGVCQEPPDLTTTPTDVVVTDVDRILDARRARAVERILVEPGPPGACPLPAPNPEARILLVDGAAGGRSTVAISGPDQVTGHAYVDIEPGEQPLYLIFTGSGSTVWTFRGAVGRVDKAVLLTDSAAAAVGLQAGQVEVVRRVEGCPESFDGATSREAARARVAVRERLGREPSLVDGDHQLTSVSLPSGRLGQVDYPELQPPRPGYHPAYWAAAMLEAPGGLVDVDPAQLQGATGRPYAVMPQTFGIAQLLGSGALEHIGPDSEFRLVRPIPHWPAGQWGWSRIFIVRGVPTPEGSIGAGCVLSGDTGAPAAGTEQNCR